MRAPLLAIRLKRQIKLSGLNLRELAKKSDVDKSTISLWTQESDDDPPRAVRVESVRAVARVLGVEAEYLLDLPHQSTEKAEDADLLRRLAALRAQTEALEDPAADLSESLKENLERFTMLSTLLEELRELTAEARQATEK